MTIKKDTKEAKEKLVARTAPAQDDKLGKLKSALEQRRESRRQDDNDDKPTAPPPVSLGPAGAIVDALINTSPEKLLELTDFDRNQVTLVPLVVVIDDMWDYVEQVAFYRMDKEHYFKVFKHRLPEIPATSRKFVHVLAQTRRSLGGKMKKALEDMALAELETKVNEDMGGVGGHDFAD
jgi:Zn-dependent M16 (insulinase) family peptidase